jgi:hypothetical protein
MGQAAMGQAAMGQVAMGQAAPGSAEQSIASLRRNDQTALGPLDQPVRPQARLTPASQSSEPALRTPETVQRQADETLPPTATPAGPAAAESTELPADPAATAINTDELARRVYAELKRRLAIEWERLRGR